MYETDEEQEPILAMNLDEYAAELAAQGVEADPVLIRMLREKEWRRAFVNNLRTAGVLIEKVRQAENIRYYQFLMLSRWPRGVFDFDIWDSMHFCENASFVASIV